ENQVLALEIKLLRLRAEIDKQAEFQVSPDLAAKAPAVADSETRLFYARSDEYATGRAALSKSLELHAREEEILQRSVNRRTAPEIDLVKARQAKQDVQAQLTGLDNEYVLSRTEEYSTVLTELTQLRANLASRQDQLTRTVLTAPTRGIVNKVLITTIGGVAPPGEPILELTPLDDELRIEAEIPPKDIAFIYPGMRSTIKLSAFDYTIYGSFEGEVLHVSADTFEKPNGRDSAPYYKVQIALKDNTLSANGNTIEVRPGMLADAELHVGKNTVIGYLVKPLFKASLAFREP
ncbi:MAG: HlyD family efflux transporter periplasmic adaptor subunit, partial [Ahrensia sp.]